MNAVRSPPHSVSLCQSVDDIDANKYATYTIQMQALPEDASLALQSHPTWNVSAKDHVEFVAELPPIFDEEAKTMVHTVHDIR